MKLTFPRVPAARFGDLHVTRMRNEVQAEELFAKEAEQFGPDHPQFYHPKEKITYLYHKDEQGDLYIGTHITPESSVTDENFEKGQNTVALMYPGIRNFRFNPDKLEGNTLFDKFMTGVKRVKNFDAVEDKAFKGSVGCFGLPGMGLLVRLMNFIKSLFGFKSAELPA